MRGEPETTPSTGKCSEMWWDETTPSTGEPNGPVGGVGLSELGPANVHNMKHYENDIAKQIQISQKGDANMQQQE
jgi:hypothetical protein